MIYPKEFEDFVLETFGGDTDGGVKMDLYEAWTAGANYGVDFAKKAIQETFENIKEHTSDSIYPSKSHRIAKICE